MKRLLPAVSTALLLTACGGTTGDTLNFDTVSVDKVVTLSNDEGSPKCSVHLQLAYATDTNGHRAEAVNNTIERTLLDLEELSMKHAADSFASSYTNSYIRNFLPLYNQDRADTTKRSWYEYHYVITTQTRQGRKGITVYQANLDFYEGGAHGINQQLVMNFDDQSGRLLTLDDVMTDGYERHLNPILEKALCEKTGAASLEDLHGKGYLIAMDMFPSQNFILDDETITFVYNPYEIAPYALGKTELTIAYDAIKNILKEDFKP